MSIKSIAAKLFAKKVYKKTLLWSSNPVATQEKVFLDLISQASITEFGKDHDFD